MLAFGDLRLGLNKHLRGIDFHFLNGSVSGLGGVYVKHGGFCLETQKWPDAVHHPKFPSMIVNPGETYRQSTIYRFSAG